MLEGSAGTLLYNRNSFSHLCENWIDQQSIETLSLFVEGDIQLEVYRGGERSYCIYLLFYFKCLF